MGSSVDRYFTEPSGKVPDPEPTPEQAAQKEAPSSVDQYFEKPKSSVDQYFTAPPTIADSPAFAKYKESPFATFVNEQQQEEPSPDPLEIAGQRFKNIGQHTANFFQQLYGTTEERKNVLDHLGIILQKNWENIPATTAILADKAKSLMQPLTWAVGLHDAFLHDPQTNVPIAINQAKVAVTSTFNDAMDMVQKSIGQAKQDGPIKFGQALVTGFLLDPVLDASRVLTGMSLDEAHVRGLDPQEYADNVTHTLANIGALAVGWGTGRAVNGMLAGTSAMAGVTSVSQLGEQMGARTLAQISRASIPLENNFARSVLTHLSAGPAAGLAYGAIEGAGSDQQAAKMLAYAIQFAPLGLAIGITSDAFGGHYTGDMETSPTTIKARAGQLANVMQFRESANSMIPDVFARNEALAGSKAPSTALAWLTKSNEITHIQDVKPDELVDINKIAAARGDLHVLSRVDPETGNHTVALVGKNNGAVNISDVVPPTAPAAAPIEVPKPTAQQARDAGFTDDEIRRGHVDPLAAQGYTFRNGQLIPADDALVERVKQEAAVRTLKLQQMREQAQAIPEDQFHNTRTSDMIFGSDSRAMSKAEALSQIDNMTKNASSYVDGIVRQNQLYKDFQSKTSNQPGTMSVDQLKNYASVPLDKIRSEERGYLDKLKQDIQQNGIQQPITLKRTPTGPRIWDGDHRLAAAEELGIKELPIQWDQTGEPVTIGTDARAFFDRTGFLPNMKVSYMGKDFYIDGVQADKLVLRNTKNPGQGTTRTVNANPSDISYSESPEFGGTLKSAFMPTNRAVYDRLYQQWNDFVRGQKPLEDAELKDGFDHSVELVAKQNGITDPKVLGDVKNEIAYRAYEDLKDKIFTKEEQNLFGQLAKEKYTSLAGARADARMTYAGIIDLANRHGMYIDQEGAGNITIRDINSDAKLASVKSLDDAKAFMVKAGAMKSVGDLDGGGSGNGLPPKIVGGDMAEPPFPIRPNESPLYQNDPYNRAKDFFYNLQVSPFGKYFTTNVKIFNALDEALRAGTDLYNQAYRPIQLGLRRFLAKIDNVTPLADRLQNEYRNMNVEDRIKVGEALESMSPEEVIDHYFQARKLNPEEVKFGQWLYDNKIDDKLMFKFREARRAIKSEPGTDDYNRRIAQIKADLGLDKDPLNWEAILKMDQLNGSLGGSVRLYRSMRNNEMTRADFINANNFTPQQRKLVSDIETTFGAFADEFNIPGYMRLSNFMTHIRLYNDGAFTPANIREMNRVGGDVGTEFYAQMARTGEIDAYERDPIVALLRYIRAGYKTQEVIPAVNLAREGVRSELQKLAPNDPRRNVIVDIYKRYEADALGIPTNIDQQFNATLGPMLERMGIRGVDANKVSTLLTTVPETATQGFKVAAGIRDFMQQTMAYYRLFGAVRTAKYLRYGTMGAEIAGKFIDQAQLMQKGIVTGLSPLIIETPGEYAGEMIGAGAITHAYDNFSKLALKVSLQPAAYRMAQTGAYLETFDTASDALKAYSERRITKAEAFKRIGLPYEISIRKQFESIVDAGDYQKAADYIAQVSAEQNIVRYGMANNLHFSRNMVGRMFSMYGTWSSFETSNLMRDMTQGTLGEITGRVARSAVTTAMIAYAAKHIGMNLGAWYMMPGSNFFDKEAPILPTLQAVGGPVYQEAQDLDEYLRSGEYGRNQLWPQLARSFPINPRTGAVEIRHLWLPGSFAADAVWRAYTAAQQGDYKSAALQVTGLKPPYNPDTYRGGGFRQF